MLAKNAVALVVLVVLTIFSSTAGRQGFEDLKRSLTHWSYYPIRDMRRTVALTPQKVSTRAPDSLSVPVQGIELPPLGASGVPLAGLDLTNRLAETLVEPMAADDSSIARGERKFTRTCVACHGVSLKGDGLVAAKFMPPPDLLSANARGRKDGFIYSYIRNGGAIMPSYGALVTAAEAWDLIHYLRHQQKVNPR